MCYTFIINLQAMAIKEKKPIVKRPPKTLKERRFVKEIATASSLADAVRKAGYDVNSPQAASQIGYENMRKLDMGSYFFAAGLTHETIAQNTTRIALTAKKIWGTGDDFIEVEDNPTQLSAMKFATDLMGLTKEKGDTNVQVVIPIHSLKAG